MTGVTKIRCALIGTGRIGSSLETDSFREKPASHAGAIRHNRETLLVAGADPDIENLARFGKLWHLKPSALFTDARTMIDEVCPDIVHIASNTEEHIPLLRLAIEKKVPVIVLEKPIASTIEEARNLLPAVDEAERTGTSRIVVNHERRFASDYRSVRNIVTSGELGTLLSIHGRLFMGMKKSPEQVLWHDGTHLVDIITFLAGNWDVCKTMGDAASPSDNFIVLGETHAEITEATPPVSIILETSPGRDHLVFELDLSFSAGRIRIGNGTYEIWKSKPSRLYEQFRSLALVRGKPGVGYGKTEYFSQMMRHAASLFHDPSLPGESTFRDGLSALELLNKIILYR